MGKEREGKRWVAGESERGKEAWSETTGRLKRTGGNIGARQPARARPRVNNITILNNHKWCKPICFFEQKNSEENEVDVGDGILRECLRVRLVLLEGSRTRLAGNLLEGTLSKRSRGHARGGIRCLRWDLRCLLLRLNWGE